MFCSLSTTSKYNSKYKKPEIEDRIIAYLIFGFWGIIIIFAMISASQPNWLQKLSEPGAISEARDYKKKGDQYLQIKNYPMAANLYKKALNINPEMHTAIGNLAIVYYKMKQYDKAISMHKYMIEKIPKLEYIAIQNLAELYVAKGDIEKAISYYNRGAEINPSPEYPLNKAGYLYVKLNQPDLAIDYFLRSLEIRQNLDSLYMGMLKKKLASPNNTEEENENILTLLKVGASSDVMKRYDITCFEEFKKHDKELAKSYKNLGDAYLLKNQFVVAEKNYDKAIEIFPLFYDAVKQKNIISDLKKKNLREN